MAFGAIAQLVARFHGMEEVAGSIPASSTTRSPNGEKAVRAFLLVRTTKSCVIPLGITGTK